MTVLIKKEFCHARNNIMEYLKKNGIESRAYFSPPVHEQAAFKCFADRELINTSEMAQRVICLPFYTSITQAEMDHVVDILADAQEELL